MSRSKNLDCQENLITFFHQGGVLGFKKKPSLVQFFFKGNNVKNRKQYFENLNNSKKKLVKLFGRRQCYQKN